MICLKSRIAADSVLTVDGEEMLVREGSLNGWSIKFLSGNGRFLELKRLAGAEKSNGSTGVMSSRLFLI